MNTTSGILLINLGTPDSPQPADVRRYLDEFLMDPYVIDIATPLRYLLVKGIILNTRPKKSAHAYQKIWGRNGSPLLYHSVNLAEGVADRMKDRSVKLAMRYGNPSIASALKAFRDEGVTQLTVVPLYPQFSFAATVSSFAKTQIEAAKFGSWFELNFVEDFFDYAPFVDAFSENIKASLSRGPWDHVLFSYHGVPERHVRHTDLSKAPGGHCFTPDCCETIVPTSNRYCYRAQCFATTRALTQKLGLSKEQHGISFQSRLGRTPWIKPYTDFVLPELAARGAKDLVVVCPAFVADCLETLEEIEIRAEADFKAAGGRSLRLVPSLNSTPKWIEAVIQLIDDPKIPKTTTPYVPERTK